MIRNFLTAVRNALSDKKGVTAAEYAILAVGIVIVVGGAVIAFQPALEQAFSQIGTQIGVQQDAIIGNQNAGR